MWNEKDWERLLKKHDISGLSFRMSHVMQVRRFDEGYFEANGENEVSANVSKKCVFSQLYLDIINKLHCVSLRCPMWWLDFFLDRLWRSYILYM